MAAGKVCVRTRERDRERESEKARDEQVLLNIIQMSVKLSLGY